MNYYWCQILCNLHYLLVFIFICHNETLFKQNNFYAGSWLKIAESNIWHLKVQDDNALIIIKTSVEKAREIDAGNIKLFFFYRWEGWWKVKGF